MKYLILFSSFLILVFNVRSQAKMSTITKHDLKKLSSSPKAVKADYFLNKLPVNRIGSNDYISLLIKVSDDFNENKLIEKGVKISSRIENIVSLKAPVHTIDDLVNYAGIDYLEIANKVKPNLNKVSYDIRSDSVYQAIDLPQAYTGKDVYIGVLDWGFDYTHPMYYDTLLEETRIAAAWDQFKQSGPRPTDFDYGTEYNSTETLLAAGSDTSNIYGFAYHGGHVAGIAGGGGAGTSFRGVAFEAEFLFATFLIDVGSVLDAYSWMYNKAQDAGKRLVINQSWGLYYMGNLDGTSLLSQAIDEYIDKGVVFTTSAGNNGNVSFHIQKDFNSDTLKSNVGFYQYDPANYWGQSLSLWGEPDKNFSINLKVFNNSNPALAETPFFNTENTDEYIDTFMVIDNDTVFYNLSAEAVNPFNGRPHVRMRVKKTNDSHFLLMQVTAQDGTVHAWNVAELTTDVGNMGTPFTDFGDGAVAGDSDYGVGEPACTERLITVASHASSYLSPNGNLYGGARSYFSSKGPIYDGRVKPDISAPGSNVMSAISSFTDAQVQYQVTMDFDGTTYGFRRLSGTSMSSPVVAGVVALMLEANPNLTADQVKEIILQTAYQDDATGDIPEEGSTSWGFGKIDAHEAVKTAINYSKVESFIKSKTFIVYPNPNNGLFTIKGDVNMSKYKLYSLNGVLVKSAVINNNTIDVREVSPGVYLFKVDGIQKPKKIIVR